MVLHTHSERLGFYCFVCIKMHRLKFNILKEIVKRKYRKRRCSHEIFLGFVSHNNNSKMLNAFDRNPIIRNLFLLFLAEKGNYCAVCEQYFLCSFHSCNSILIDISNGQLHTYISAHVPYIDIHLMQL